MTSLLRHGLIAAAVLFGAAGCSENGAFLLPTAPSGPPSLPPSPPPVVSPSAIPVVLGETVGATVSTSDPGIETSWGPEPCVRFAVTTSAAGDLRVRLKSSGPSGLTLWVNRRPFWGDRAEVSGNTRVDAGLTYEIVVSIHEPLGPSQPFELTTSLSPL